MSLNAGDIIDVVSDIGELADSAGKVARDTPGIAAAARGFCRVMAGTPGGRLLQALDVGNICSPFWAEDGIGPPGEGPPPFSGGQCPGVLYQLGVNYTEGGEGRSVTRSTNLPGPVSGYRFDLQVIPNPPFSPVYSLRVGNDQGLAQDPGLGDSPEGVLFSRVTSNVLEEGDFFFFRADGQPDLCGDPPPTFLPSPDWDGSGVGDPQVVPGPDGKDYQITVGPFDLSPSGELSIPVDVGGVEINLGNGGGPSSSPSQSGPEIDGGGGGELPIPPAPEGQRCVAVIFRFAGFPSVMGRVVGGSENVRYYEVFGNADVYVESDGGGGEWIGNKDLQSGQVVIGVPATGLGITRARANLKVGITYTATPVYANV